jgi:hypothetical protein
MAPRDYRTGHAQPLPQALPSASLSA